MFDASAEKYKIYFCCVFLLFLGCEINVKPTFRDRSRSGRFSRDGRKNATGSRPSIIDWPIGKFSWLKDRQKTNTKGTGTNFLTFLSGMFYQGWDLHFLGSGS